MGYTFRFFAEGVDAVEREFGYGRTLALSRPSARRRAHVPGLPRLRHFPENRIQDSTVTRSTASRLSPTARAGRCAMPISCPARSKASSSASSATNPHWGARKIRELLIRRLPGDVRLPAKSTIHAVLDRNGLIKRNGPKRNRAAGTPLSAGTAS